MDVQTPIPGRPAWTAHPLYRFMLQIFPERRTESGILDIQSFCSADTGLGKSHEAIYKWLRSGQMKPSNARAMLDLALQPVNLAALERSGTAPPRYEDFLPFLN